MNILHDRDIAFSLSLFHSFAEKASQALRVAPIVGEMFLHFDEVVPC